MRREFCLSCIVVAVAVAAEVPALAAAAEWEGLVREFREYSGASLVFRHADLPPGRYHDVLYPLVEARRANAAAICLREVKKYPPGYLGNAGLKAIGVFAACVSKTGDGFRAYDAELGGYRYYGAWNGADGVAAAYYTNDQLPLTFHHEVFHHLDATYQGKTAPEHYASDDPQFQAAVSGRQQRPAPAIAAGDLASLKRLQEGYLLRGAVSDYAAKNSGEDQAETARHLMTNLADCLVQTVEQPELPGSQRILHVLREYELAVKDGPGVDWFVDVALGRAGEPADGNRRTGDVSRLLTQLRAFAEPGRSGYDGVLNRGEEARQILEALPQIDRTRLPKPDAASIVPLAAAVTHHLMWERVRPANQQRSFYIWGQEDENGVNWTLRADVGQFAADAARLKRIASKDETQADILARTQMKSLRLLACYYAYIASNWTVSSGTQQAFESARNTIADSLPSQQASLAKTLKATELLELSWRIPPDGEPRLLSVPQPAGKTARDIRVRDNPYLQNVNGEIEDSAVRTAIRRVQPACVRLAGASGVCISASGTLLTAAHVPAVLGQKLVATFPDGSRYWATCTAIDHRLDLAVMTIEGADDLPFAPVAPKPPAIGTPVVAIGQPASVSPGGGATGYQPFHVSAGRIRGFLPDRLGPQTLGAAMHDAWTYWGHSGCPLFNHQGQIVAIHNSWDSTTAMRHAVPHEAIVHFLNESGADYAAGR